MKKHTTILAAIALLTMASNRIAAQETKDAKSNKNILIGLTGGVSSPMGNFAKSDYSNPTSGFASAGYNIGVTGTYYLTKHFGISALASYQAYGFNGLQSLADGYHADFEVDSASADVNGKSYSLNLLVGPSYSLTLTKQLMLDARILIGVSNAHLAGYTIYLEDNSSATFSQNKSSATALGMQAGLALRYNINKRVYAAINGDYCYTKPNLQIDYNNRNNHVGRWLTGYNEAFASLNLNLTLGISINR